MDEKMCPLLTAAIWSHNGGIGIEPCRGDRCMWWGTCSIDVLRTRLTSAPQHNAPDDEGRESKG